MQPKSNKTFQSNYKRNRRFAKNTKAIANLFEYLNKIDNGFYIPTENLLFSNMFQFVSAILFVIKLSKNFH